MNNIIQFSPIRSGSTLIFNIIKKLGFNPEKKHVINFRNDCKYVITLRHPYNSIASHFLRYKKDTFSSDINSGISEYLENGGSIIAEANIDSENILLLKYEDFFLDMVPSINLIAKFLSVDINASLSKLIANDLNIDNIKKKTKSFKDFSEYDTKTQWHGNHVSEYKGLTNYNKLFKKEQIKILKNNKTLSKILDKYYL